MIPYIYGCKHQDSLCLYGAIKCVSLYIAGIMSYTTLKLLSKSGIIMNIKELVIKQYREIIDTASKRVAGLTNPSEGWLRTNRKALKMPTKIILEKAGIKKSELYRIEKAELEGTLTLNKLKETAEAMGCELHYAVVPGRKIDSIIEDRARRHAIKILRNASVHMQLENQATNKEQVEFQIDKVAKKLIAEIPSWFWEKI